MASVNSEIVDGQGGIFSENQINENNININIESSNIESIKSELSELKKLLEASILENSRLKSELEKKSTQQDEGRKRRKPRGNTFNLSLNKPVGNKVEFSVPTKNKFESIANLEIDDHPMTQSETDDDPIILGQPPNININAAICVHTPPTLNESQRVYHIREKNLISKKKITSANNNNNNSNISSNIRTENNQGNNQKINNKKISDETSTTGNKKELVKCPPIMVYYQSAKDSAAVLTDNNIKNFTIKRNNKNKHQILTNNVETFKLIQEKLNSVAAQFFTFTPKSEKNKVLLLKGLSNEEHPDDIFNELKNFETNSLIFNNVKNFSTPKSTRNKTILPIYTVHVTPKSDLNELKKIKYINHQLIYWENLKKMDMIQCKNCQRYGHSAANCKLQYRCVKCNNQHNPEQCKMVKNDDENTLETVYCINCKVTGHPASYRGCPIYKNLIRKIKEVRENNKNSNKNKNQTQPNGQYRIDNNSLIKNGTTFADMIKRQPEYRPSFEQANQQDHQIQHHQSSIQGLEKKITDMLQNERIITEKSMENFTKVINDKLYKIENMMDSFMSIINKFQ